MASILATPAKPFYDIVSEMCRPAITGLSNLNSRVIIGPRGATKGADRLLPAGDGVRRRGTGRVRREPRPGGRRGQADAVRARGRARRAVPRDGRGRARADARTPA